MNFVNLNLKSKIEMQIYEEFFLLKRNKNKKFENAYASCMHSSDIFTVTHYACTIYKVIYVNYNVFTFSFCT